MQRGQGCRGSGAVWTSRRSAEAPEEEEGPHAPSVLLPLALVLVETHLQGC